MVLQAWITYVSELDDLLRLLSVTVHMLAACMQEVTCCIPAHAQ